MAKYLREVLGKHTKTKKTNDLGGYKPKAGDEEKFAKDHDIEVHTFDGTDDQRDSGKVKYALASKKEKRHKDAGKVYEDNLDELSKTTLGNYIKSASADVGHKKADAAYSNMSGDDNQANKNTMKARKRLGGIYTAVNKLSKEEVDLDKQSNNAVGQNV
jgi:hypothetical protein